MPLPIYKKGKHHFNISTRGVSLEMVKSGFMHQSLMKHN